ncbi:PAS domain-containing protein [Phenylobacterium koreense]|uniref:PAS domain-containing protein n=1 Tax=Phenylobacterium koreense TaxID=266125 RepID=A0ABV2EF20_9CAUL
MSADMYSSWSSSASPAQSGSLLETSHAAVLDHMAEAFMALDDRMRISAVNHVFEAMMGLSASQMLGRTWEDLFPSFTSAVLRERLQRVLRTREAQEFEASGDGFGRHRYSVHAFPYPGGLAVLIQNRTAEHELRLAAHEGKALEEALGALSKVMVLRLNMHGLLTGIGRDFADLVGFTHEELAVRRLTDLAQHTEQTGLADALESVMETARPAQLDATLIAKDGRALPVRLGVSAIVDDLTSQGLVATVAIA